MRKKIIVLLIMAALTVPILSVGTVQAQGENDQAALKDLLGKLDSAISSLRRGDSGGASTAVSNASTIYKSNFSPRVENIDNQLDTKIAQAFSSLAQTPVEENIFVLRVDVSRAANLIGVSLSPIYTYSMFIILGVGVVMSLLITLVNKRVVNWDLVRENKAKIAEFQKELRDARSKRDMKQLHKIQQRQGEIAKLQGQVLSQTFKPAIFYFIPLILIWNLLGAVYSGWVVAWLPFTIDLPVFGRLVAFGIGWWYFLTYLGFSQIFRKILIRE
ncbi:MAG: EMC3/TMCO1 family protein [Hadesarchaea archaeon]|nr:EMC3/TMCO1 family protein [Hadesarchaea archaeon]